MTNLEKKIQEYLDENRDSLDKKSWLIYDASEKKVLYEPGSATCARGSLSVLNALYGIDVDKSPMVCCFRAESNQKPPVGCKAYDWERETRGGKLKDTIHSMMDCRERKTAAWIADNLKGDWLREEQVAYGEVFNGLDSSGEYAFFQHFDMFCGGNELSELLQRLAEKPDFFPDPAFLSWMKDKAGIE